MTRRWTDDHGADGVRRKFDVYKPRDGQVVDCDNRFDAGTVYLHEDRIGADGEFVVVLRPETDEAACMALREYALEVIWRAPQFAADIITKLEEIETHNRKGTSA